MYFQCPDVYSAHSHSPSLLQKAHWDLRHETKIPFWRPRAVWGIGPPEYLPAGHILAVATRGGWSVPLPGWDQQYAASADVVYCLLKRFHLSSPHCYYGGPPVSWVWGPISCPHVCEASSLPTDLSPLPDTGHFDTTDRNLSRHRLEGTGLMW